MATHTENTDALRQILRAFRGAGELLTVFEDAQAAQTLLSEAQGRLQKLRTEETALTAKLNGLAADVTNRAQAHEAARIESEKAIAVSTSAALQDAARRIDEANAQAATVERESAARIAEATAKVGVAEAALAETTRKYEDAQRALDAIKAKIG